MAGLYGMELVNPIATIANAPPLLGGGISGATLCGQLLSFRGSKKLFPELRILFIIQQEA